MKSPLVWQTVQNLEHSVRQPIQTRRTWKAKLNDLWQTTIAYLAASDEPHVWRSQDEQGDVLWNAYDPRTGHSFSNVSESELRAWLEERHYQTI